MWSWQKSEQRVSLPGQMLHITVKEQRVGAAGMREMGWRGLQARLEEGEGVCRCTGMWGLGEAEKEGCVPGGQI